MAHISLNEKGVPVIEGTRMKVAQLVALKRTNNLTPEALREQFPHLSLGQIYAALAYYYDHQTEVDADIERRNQFVAETEAEARKTQPPAREWLQRAKQRGVDPAVIVHWENELGNQETFRNGSTGDEEIKSGAA